VSFAGQPSNIHGRKFSKAETPKVTLGQIVAALGNQAQAQFNPGLTTSLRVSHKTA